MHKLLVWWPATNWFLFTTAEYLSQDNKKQAKIPCLPSETIYWRLKGENLLVSLLKSWSSKRASFPFSNAEYLHRLQEFCVCISSPWPVLERFFGGFYGGVEKPSLGFIVLNEIVKMEAITKVDK